MLKTYTAWLVVLAFLAALIAPDYAYAAHSSGRSPDLSGVFEDHSGDAALATLGIVAGVLLVGGLVALLVKHHKHHSSPGEKVKVKKSALKRQLKRIQIESCQELLTPAGERGFATAWSSSGGKTIGHASS